MSFADQVLAEIARLEAELESDPRYKMLAQLRAVASLAPRVYGAGDGQIDADDAEARRVGRRTSPARAQALEIVSKFLTRYCGPVTTAALYDEVLRQGIELGGDNPQNNLSALLYHSKLFTSHGRRGWTLKNPGEEDEAVEDERTDKVSSVAPDEPPPAPRRQIDLN